MRMAAAGVRGIALAAILTFVAPGPRPVRAADFGSPSAALADSLSRQHRRHHWLIIATDSLWLDASVQKLGPAGLDGIDLRHSNRNIEHLPWPAIRAIDRRSSLHGPGQVAGLLVGGIGFAAWALESDPSQIGMAGTMGALLGLWLGGKIGGLWVRDRPLYRSAVPRVVAIDSAASISGAMPGPRQNPDAWAIWLTPQYVGSFPQRAFRPVGPDRLDGKGGVITFAPPRVPIGLRLSFDTATARGHQSGVFVPIFGSGTTAEVRTSNRIDWLMAGPLWDPRPRRSSVYLFAAGGLVRVTPAGSAQWGTGVLGVPLTYDMPGLPPSSTGFAASAGAGVRLAFGRAKKLALAAELDYRHAGSAYYLGAPGSEGSPDPRYSSRYDAIDAVAIRLGLAASWDRRFAVGP